MKLPEIHIFNEFCVGRKTGRKNRIGGFSGGGIGSSESKQTTKSTNNQSTVQGGAAGSNSVSVGGGNSGRSTSTVNISDDPAIVSRALDSVDNAVTGGFLFGAETETIASQTVGESDATINALAGQITGNAAGIDPSTGQPVSNVSTGFDWNTLVLPLTLLGGLATLLTFYRTKGTNT